MCAVILSEFRWKWQTEINRYERIRIICLELFCRCAFQLDAVHSATIFATIFSFIFPGCYQQTARFPYLSSLCVLFSVLLAYQIQFPLFPVPVSLTKNVLFAIEQHNESASVARTLYLVDYKNTSTPNPCTHPVHMSHNKCERTLVTAYIYILY